MKKQDIVYRLIFLCSFSLIAISISAQLNGSYTIGGNTPDYTTFTDALNDLILVGVDGPVIFLVREGMYNESFEIPAISGSSIDNTITFRSESGDSTAVILHYPSQGAPLWTLNGSAFIGFEQITFANTGTQTLQHWEMLGNLTDIWFEGCVFRTNLISCCDYYFDVYLDQLTNLSISGCYFDSVYGGVYFQPNVDSLYNLSIVDNYFAYAQYPIEVRKAIGVNISNNTIAGDYTYAAFYMRDSRNLIVENNYVEYCDDALIELYDSHEGIISGNVANYCDDYLIYVEESDDLIIRDNMSNNYSRFGIESEYSNKLEIVGNYLENAEYYGIYVYDGTDNVVKDNTIIDPVDFGIYIEYAYDNLEVSGNEIINQLDNSSLVGLSIDNVYVDEADFQIFNNKITGVDGNKGLSLDDINCTPSNRGLVYNNMISGFEYCLDLNRLEYTDVYFNSINTFGETWNAVYARKNENVEFYNNIIAFESEITVTVEVIYLDTVSSLNMDYNVYFYDESDPDIVFSTLSSTLADHQSNYNMDLNSIIADPQFFDDMLDLRICNDVIMGAGTPITGITSDYFGDSRAAAPTPGAYEMKALAAGFDYIQSILTVEFFDNSTNNVSGYLWDFGDGNTSTEKDPVHTYSNAGTYDVTLTVTDFCTAATEDVVIQVSVSETGIEDNTAASLTVFPNPTNGILMINSEEIHGEVMVNLYDRSGRRIFQESLRLFEGTNSLHIDHLNDGLYFLELATENKRYSQKILKSE